MVRKQADEYTALNQVIEALRDLESDARQKVLRAVVQFFDLDAPVQAARIDSVAPQTVSSMPTSADIPKYSDTPTTSPKEFIRSKQPQTDVEKVACLAYYLTHYRDLPHFKTLELSKLNTEAAQPKFSNAAKASANALQYGYLASAGRGGLRQISAAGEEFVRVLPDRDLAKEAMNRGRPKRKVKSRK